MFFVAVGFSDKKIAGLFDLARLILQPDYSRKAHITLRGPYRQKKDINDSVLGRDVGQIILRGPGHFFEGSQNTVFLGVEIAGIADFWRKPDFPEGVPHLSIYDGSDRRFAWGVFNVLKRHKWGVFLNSSTMHVLEKKSVLETGFIVDYASVSEAMNFAFSRVYSTEDVKAFDELERLSMLHQICGLVHSLTHPSSKH